MRLLSAFLIFIFTTGFAPRSADEMGRMLIDAMGGADAWAGVRTVHNHAVNHHPNVRLVYTQEYWFDTERPAQRIHFRNFDVDWRRAFTPDGGWLFAEGETTPMNAERHGAELWGWSHSLYRKFILLARRPEGLRLDVGEGGRLEFFLDGEFLGWMTIDENGAPLRHGAREAPDEYYYYDELIPFGSINWPRSGGDQTGWRFEILAIKVSPDPPPVDFEKP